MSKGTKNQGNAKVNMEEVMGDFNNLMGALEMEKSTPSSQLSHTPFEDISVMVQRSNETSGNEREADQTEDRIFSRRTSGVEPPTRDSYFSYKSGTAAPPLPRESLANSSSANETTTVEQNVHAQRTSIEDQTLVGVLERNTSSILDALSDERKRSAMLQDDIDMTKLEKDAQIDDMRLVIHRLKNQVRALVSERSLEEVYGVMEDEVGRLTRSLDAERRRCVALENKLLDSMMSCRQGGAVGTGRLPGNASSSSSSSSSSSGSDEESDRAVDLSHLSTDLDDRMAGVGEVTFVSNSGLSSGSNHPSHHRNNSSLVMETVGLTHKESRRLIQQVKHLNKVVNELKQANEGLKSTERLHTISVRQTKDAARRVFLANQQAEKLRVDLEKEKENHSSALKSLSMVRNEIGALHDDNRGLRQQLENCSLEMAHMHKQMVEAEVKRRKEKKIEQFVSKHVPAGAGSKQSSGASKLKEQQQNTNKHKPNSSFTAPHASSVFDLNMSMMSHMEDIDDVGSQAQNHSFRKALRKAQRDTHQLRSIQKHKLDESALNDLLTELRAVTVFKAPDLLPLIRSVISALADEREVWRQMALAVKKAGVK